MAVVIISFLGGMGYGGFAALSSDSPNGVIAVIGKEKIKAGDLNRILKAQEESYKRIVGEIDSETYASLRMNVLSSMISESMVVQIGRNLGISVSDFEVGHTIRTSPYFNNNGWFDKREYIWVVRNNLGMTPAEYEEQERRQLLRYRTMMFLASAYKVSPQEIEENYRDQYAGNMKKFAENKATFEPTIVETKTENLFDGVDKKFRAENEITTYLLN
ncbi:peptidyl-prolyl cis-trans isomerase D [Elusimicrobium posterum]